MIKRLAVVAVLLVVTAVVAHSDQVCITDCYFIGTDQHCTTTCYDND